MAADAEGVAVLVAEVELANTPRLVSGRHGHIEPEFKSASVHRVDFIETTEEP